MIGIINMGIGPLKKSIQWTGIMFMSRGLALFVSLLMGLLTVGIAGPGCGNGKNDPDNGGPALSVRLLAAGDSITYGAGGNYFGYRRFLVELGGVAGRELLLIGSVTENLGTGEGHEGHPGWTAEELRVALPLWLEIEEPDILVLHIGTNDIYEGLPLAGAVEAIDKSLETVLRQAPSCLTVLSTIGPYRSPKNSQAVQLNQELRAMAARRAAAGQRIVLADSYRTLTDSGVSLEQLLSDSAHPSDLGYYLMAKEIWQALAAANSP